jgi:chromosomal replication initiator protein
MRGAVNDATYRLWFERTLPLGLEEGVFVIGVPNDFARDWIDSRFHNIVHDALAAVMGPEVEFRTVVDERAAAMQGEPLPVPAVDAATEGEVNAPPETTDGDAPMATGLSGLNPRYVFDRWVVGPHNEYATAVAHSVADSPAGAYNPVFIYADTGLGKTHLMHAIAHQIMGGNPRSRVRYVTVERFTDDFISAVTEKGRIEGFKQQYRNNDVLLIDDVQFLAEKQQTQVEFFHTFNALYEAGKQIVITSDRQPRELEELDDRLRSRFGGGVVVDIGRPDLETRIAILRRQVKAEGLRVDDAAVLEHIAGRVSSNIRDLEGALRRTVSYASITHSQVDLDLTKEALKDILPSPYSQPITIEMVQSEVARQFGVHVSDLRSDKRTAQIAYARQVAMYLCRELTESSLPQLGERFGGRHHTTVLYATNKISRLLTDDRDRQLHEVVHVITSRLKTPR